MLYISEALHVFRIITRQRDMGLFLVPNLLTIFISKPLFVRLFVISSSDMSVGTPLKTTFNVRSSGRL